MAAKTFTSLGPHFERFVQNQLETNRYADASEVVQAGLRLLEEAEKLRLLRQALIDGEQSGWVYDFDATKFMERMRAKTKS